MRKNYMSYCYMRMNSATDEKICVGMFFVVEGKVSLRISKKKMEICKALHPSGFNLVKSYYEQVERGIGLGSEMSMTVLMHESRSQNGVVAISFPQLFVVSEDDKEGFMDKFFDNNVENSMS